MAAAAYSLETNSGHRKAFAVLAFLAVLCSCTAKSVIPKNGNLSLMPVIKDASYYDNANGYADNAKDYPASKLIEPLLERAVASGLPGCVVLVDTPETGTWVCAKGNIDIKNDIPIKKNSMSRIASITKTFVTVIVLQLAQEGRLALDDPISNYLPRRLVGSIENADKASIRQLLNNTSGIFDYSDLPQLGPEGLFKAGSNKNLSSEKCLEMIFGRKANFKPGEKTYYCNTGFILLGLIVEALEKKPIKEVFQERIFEPLEMKSTYYDPDKPVHRETARGYADPGNTGNYIDMSDMDGGCRTPDGGIVSNVYDLSHFIKALFEDRSFLSASSLAEMTGTMRKLENRGNVEYGLGLMRFQFGNGVLMYGHSGGDISYAANLYYFPERKMTVATLFNCSIFVGKSAKILNSLWWSKILDILVYEPTGKPTFKRLYPATTASIRETLPSSDDQKRLWDELNDYLRIRHIAPVAPGFTVYYGNKGRRVDLEIVQPVDQAGTGGDLVRFGKSRPCDMAAIVQKGPLSGTLDSYALLNRWIVENGYQENGPSREYYYKNERNETDPSEFVTEIQIPIRRK